MVGIHVSTSVVSNIQSVKRMPVINQHNVYLVGFCGIRTQLSCFGVRTIKLLLHKAGNKTQDQDNCVTNTATDVHHLPVTENGSSLPTFACDLYVIYKDAVICSLHLRCPFLSTLNRGLRVLDSSIVDRLPAAFRMSTVEYVALVLWC